MKSKMWSYWTGIWKDKVMNDGTIEENLPSKHFGYCRRISTPEKSEKAHLVVFGFPAYSGEYVEKDKWCCKNPLNYTGSTTNMIMHLQYCHLAEYNELVSLLKSKPVSRLKLQNYLKGSCPLKNPLEKWCHLHSSKRWRNLAVNFWQQILFQLIQWTIQVFRRCSRC